MTRIELLNEIIDLHIENLSEVKAPQLMDTKTLTEILKSILVLEQIKKLEGRKTEFDSMSESELEKRLQSLGGGESAE